jgi:hypothetical protein
LLWKWKIAEIFTERFFAVINIGINKPKNVTGGPISPAQYCRICQYVRNFLAKKFPLYRPSVQKRCPILPNLPIYPKFLGKKLSAILGPLLSLICKKKCGPIEVWTHKKSILCFYRQTECQRKFLNSAFFSFQMSAKTVWININ